MKQKHLDVAKNLNHFLFQSSLYTYKKQITIVSCGAVQPTEIHQKITVSEYHITRSIFINLIKDVDNFLLN